MCVNVHEYSSIPQKHAYNNVRRWKTGESNILLTGPTTCVMEENNDVSNFVILEIIVQFSVGTTGVASVRCLFRTLKNNHNQYFIGR